MSHDTWKARLHTKMDALAQWHQKIAFFHIIAPLPMTRLFVLLAVAASLFAALANYQIRANQYERWVDNKDVTFLDGTPLFSTTDASFFVGLAQQYRLTGDKRDHTAKRLYPYHKNNIEQTKPQTSARDFPLLSVLIAILSPDASTRSLMLTAHALIPLLAFVMALGVVIAFGASGFWLEGAVAAVGAGLAPTFLMRSSVGRIDTDILNLGFFYCVLGLTIFAARSKTWRAAIIWASLSALCLYLFFWWYEKAFMGWAFAIGLMWLSFITHRDWRRPLVLGFIFIVLSGLLFNQFGIGDNSSYLQENNVKGVLIYPNTFNTITELRVIPFSRILESITGSLLTGSLGVLGLAMFAYRYPVTAVVYGPASIFALANFLIGNRAVFYSAPMIWFGLAYFAILSSQIAMHLLNKHLRTRKITNLALPSLVIAVLMGAILSDKGTRNYTPNPSFPKQIMEAFAAARGNLPEGAVIATWWDYGYASMLFNGYNTLHDGGIQTSPVTHYFARSLLAETQSQSNAILHLLAGGGLQALEDNSGSKEAIETIISTKQIKSEAPIFLVLTSQMASWMGSISDLGMWDTETGQPINAKNSRYGPTLFYSNLRCRATEVSYQAVCDNRLVDLQSGTIDNAPVINKFTQATDGILQQETRLNGGALNHLHLSEISEGNTSISLFHDRLARSTFHNLFHLAKVDETQFQLVYDDYPHARIYQVK